MVDPIILVFSRSLVDSLPCTKFLLNKQTGQRLGEGWSQVRGCRKG